MFKDFQDNIHTLACLELLVNPALRNTDGLTDGKRVVLDGRYHTGQCRSRHLYAHTERADGRTEGRNLVDGNARLGTDGTDTLYEVGNLRSRRGTGGTQTVNGRCNLLHGDGSSTAACYASFLQLLADLLHLTGSNGDTHYLSSSLLTHFRQGNHQLVGCLCKALYVLLGLQAQLTGSADIQVSQVVAESSDLVGSKACGLTHLTHLV